MNELRQRSGAATRAALVTMAVVGISIAATPAAAAEKVIESSPAASDRDVVGTVDLATATEDDLQRLPGIGPKKAKAIVEYRGKRAFKKVSDIRRVKGIGPATFKRLRPHLTLSDAPMARTVKKAKKTKAR